ncbi:receptor [Nesidiocoris tenuis]|uniref:Receptor n=1 Tax=Nesidiocoris tenuis TaxID=355587 RepID=A0ABN7B2B2_9HEMI|nr:receptor [Nesidiocoris tenuis]
MRDVEEKGEAFEKAHNRLVADLDQHKFEVEETQSFTNEVATAISKLKEKDIRIVLGNFNETWARHIFCEAQRVGMTGRKYQWLIMGTYGPSWWLEPAPCPSHTLAQALDGVILTDLLPLATSGEITISGITADEYKEEYDSRRGNEYSRFHGYTYDGVWAVALAIQHVTHRVRHFRKDQTVVDFQYRDPLWEQLFVEALKNTSFEGVTGPVRFYDNERKASILLKQFQNGTEVKVGEYNAVNHDLDLDRGQVIRWAGRGPPKDRTLQIFEHSHVNVAIYSSLAVVASLGIILASIFLGINIKFRNQRYIKMSSPYLNNLIIIGSILTYSSVIFLGLDSRLTSVQAFPYICTARAWLLMAGFSLAFGAMFSKTWRVHSIFTDVKLNKKVIKDYQLYMVVGVLLAIDLGIMTTWQVADPFFRSTKLMEPYPHPHSEDIIIYPENEYCRSHYMNIFVGIIYAYKGLLMIFGAFLAWETRHVSIPALNDSKYVGMSVYNVVLMCIMGAAVSFVLSDEQNAAFVLISVFTIFCATITLCLVFVPKLVELRRNPQGVIDKRIRATLRPTSKTRRDSSELEEKVKEAKDSNQRWRKMLLERENELQNLLKIMGQEDKVLPTLPPPQEVSLLKKEPPSATETTELSSVCSNTSSHEDRLGVSIGASSVTSSTAPATAVSPAPTVGQPLTQSANQIGNQLVSPPTTDFSNPVDTSSLQRKKTTFSNANMTSSTKLTSNSTAPTSTVPAAALEEMTVGTSLSVISEARQAIKQQQQSPSSQSSSKAVSWEAECPRGSSNSLRRRSSGVRTSHTPPPQRRTSMPGRRTPTFVHQDELWLTQTRHCRTRCSNPATNEVPDDEEVSVIQRSVSERRDKCCHGGSSGTLPATVGASVGVIRGGIGGGIGSISGTSSLKKKPSPSLYQSTPNVLGTAISEGELLDLSILPIFQKLLTERKGAAIASCPNIAIKCDIVEYL